MNHAVEKVNAVNALPITSEVTSYRPALFLRKWSAPMTVPSIVLLRLFRIGVVRKSDLGYSSIDE